MRQSKRYRHGSIEGLHQSKCQSVATGRSAGRTSAAARSEGNIPWRSIHTCDAGGSLCRKRDRAAICLCDRAEAPPPAGLPLVGAVARAADTCLAIADPRLVRNDRWIGHGHFWSRWHLGSQASRGRSAPSGAAGFLASAHHYFAAVFAAVGTFWRNHNIRKCRRPGASAHSSNEHI